MGHERAAVWAVVAATVVLTAALAGWAQSARQPAPAAAPSPPLLPPEGPPVAGQGPVASGPAPVPMAFGADAASVAAQATLGMPVDYGTLWVGAWTLQWGWTEADRQLTALRAQNVTPAIHFYYWGDDISPRCIEQGCNGKSQAGWDRLAHELLAHLNATLGDHPSLVFLETEFNKGSVARYAPLDALLAEKATLLRTSPHIHVVLALGNWNPAAWTTWRAAAAASDFAGLQAMFGSTRDDPDTMAGIVNRTVAGARQLAADFGKPILLHDIAFSSYPEPQDLAPQAAAVRMLFDCLAPLKAAGVQAMLYRGLQDNPKMDLGNYYGQAERHFGLAWADSLKPAGEAWREGVQRERATAAVPGPHPGC